MATNKPIAKTSNVKKELKKELAAKIESALPEMKTKLGDKKFHSRIKKAAKLIVHGLHEKNFSEADKSITTDTATPKKAKAVKKVGAKKQKARSN